MSSISVPRWVRGPASRSSGGNDVPHQNSFLAPSTLLNVADSSEVGEVRRFAQGAAEEIGFDETRTGKVAIVATELANNLVRHAGGGVIVARVYKGGEAEAIDLLSLDRG